MAYTTPPKISQIRHPQYTANLENWLKWRLAYQSGTQFMRKYLKKFSKREDDRDFSERMAVSYVPPFAKSAINEVKNSIFARITDVTRDGGTRSYEDAVIGLNGGVDLKGSTMNAFIGRNLLPELLSMSRVGVYVDMPPLPGPTMADKQGIRPYLYWYKTEDILCWADCYNQSHEFKAVLLQDTIHAYDNNFNLPSGVINRFRYVWIDDEDGFVHVKFYNVEGQCIDDDGSVQHEDYEYILPGMTKIPFVLLELSESLLNDAADCQISLMNLASSDMAYALKANYPFYTEQVDWRAQSPYLKGKTPGQTTTSQSVLDPTMMSDAVVVNQEKVRDIRVGVAAGRQYGLGTERPAFIHPSSEPLQISMAKQEQLKAEIRQMVHLAVASLEPRSASAESKKEDNRSLEDGLAYIGLELAHAERKIAEFWAMYEGGVIATIAYPETYQLLSETDRRNQADHYVSILPAVSSLTYQKEIAKRLVRLELGNKISLQKLRKIETEIDAAEVIVSAPDVITQDLENGLLSLELASKIRGYPEGQVELAKEDHADRIARIALAQTKGLGAGAEARGVNDLGGDPKAASAEKADSRDNTLKDQVKDRTRGAGDSK